MASAFLKDLEDVTLEDIGLTATFTCEVSQSDLKPDWLKADKSIKKSDKYEMTSRGGTHTLVIKDCQAEDVAKYSVKLNGMQSSAKLDVKGGNWKESLKFNKLTTTISSRSIGCSPRLSEISKV